MARENNSIRANGHAKSHARANGSATGALARAASPGEDAEKIPPGEAPLPERASEFIEEIHRRVDLCEVWSSLLRSSDLKIRQRAAEKLTELRYKVAAEDEPQPLVIDIDTAVGRRAAEGAQE